jgi:hypothetical protein
LEDVLVLLLEIFVGLASFVGCLVAVDKLYLFYATVFYKAMAMWRPASPARRSSRGPIWC